jgi:hypothetical protein
LTAYFSGKLPGTAPGKSRFVHLEVKTAGEFQYRRLFVISSLLREFAESSQIDSRKPVLKKYRGILIPAGITRSKTDILNI